LFPLRGQAFGLGGLLLPGTFGLLVVTLLGLGRALVLPALLRGLPRHLSLRPVLFGGPRLAHAFLFALAIALGFLARCIHLDEQRLTPGHHASQGTRKRQQISGRPHSATHLA
jgi:hypothetical protein